MSFVARVTVGLVLLVAGALKLTAGRRWRTQAQAFGTPALLVPLVPVAELVIGALLVPGVGGRATALAAAGLLAAFTVLVVLKVATGDRTPCACFGSMSADPVGPWTVIRNVVLLALAVVAAL